MSLASASPTTKTPDPGTADTRLRGRWLFIARLGWIAAVALVLSLFLISLPIYLAHLQTVCVRQPCTYEQLTLRSTQALQALGISVGGYVALTLMLTLGVALVYVVTGGVLVWRRSDDWMALLVAFMLVVEGAANGINAGANTSQAEYELPTTC